MTWGVDHGLDGWTPTSGVPQTSSAGTHVHRLPRPPTPTSTDYHVHRLPCPPTSMSTDFHVHRLPCSGLDRQSSVELCARRRRRSRSLRNGWRGASIVDSTNRPQRPVFRRLRLRAHMSADFHVRDWTVGRRLNCVPVDGGEAGVCGTDDVGRRSWIRRINPDVRRSADFVCGHTVTRHPHQSEPAHAASAQARRDRYSIGIFTASLRAHCFASS
jgi:hypothetical protein